MGLEQITFQQDAAKLLIEKYCREAGVRNLQKHIEKIFRKIAYKFVSESREEAKILISPKNLHEFVGKPIFESDRFYPQPPCGVTMGLSWTELGGATLYIETVVEPDTSKEKGRLHITGQMGSVMKESTEIAHTYSKVHWKSLLQRTRTDPSFGSPPLDSDFFSSNTVHMHVPEGATPKVLSFSLTV